MDQAKIQQWFENYALWRKEATAEALEMMKSKGYTEINLIGPYNNLSVRDDGSVFWEHKHANGLRNDFQSRWIKQKVTAWKDSKHYVEI